jgi:large subunit ribosomal protein L1
LQVAKSESIDVACLSVDAKKSDQVVAPLCCQTALVRPSALPFFAQGAKADEAKAAGADIVGMDDLVAADIKAGKMDFTVDCPPT